MSLPSKYVQSSAYAFHTTPRENSDSIRTEGVRRDVASNSDSTDILSVLDELGYSDPFPFNREEATYCHIDAEFVAATLRMGEESGLSSDKVALVVDIREIDAPVYLADMSILTDLLDYRYAGPEHMLHGDTPDEVVALYTESIAPVHGPADIDAYLDSDVSYPELVIDGDIPASAIVDMVDFQAEPASQ